MEATIITWLKKEGETVEQDESLLEVATDKVDTEVPTTHGGVIKELLAAEGEVVEIGKPIAVIDTEQEEDADTPAPKAEKTEKKKPEVKEAMADTKPNGHDHNKEQPEPAVVSSGGQDFSKSNRFYSPLVRNIAKEENISIDELDQIPGSGKEGRVTKQDIMAYLKGRSAAALKKAPAEKARPKPVPVPVSAETGDEIVEMDRMRKIIAERMIQSKHTAAHVQSFVEADLTNVVKWRSKVKDDFLKKHGEKLTFTPIFMEAIIQALHDYPGMNAAVDGEKIIRKKNVNIGMAVALPNYNLIVPVIKNADQLNLVGLTKQVNDLAERARNNKLTADDLSGATYSVSNVGSFGSIMGTPIIPLPQVGILALGAIRKKPAVIETPDGDLIGIRHKMILSHSYDHRVIDGALGGLFVKRVAEYLEGFDTDRNV